MWCNFANLHHQTVHFFSGFIWLPLGQLKSFAKSSLLLSGPIILNAPGEWVSVRIWAFLASSVFTAHQFWKLNWNWKLSWEKSISSTYSNFPSQIFQRRILFTQQCKKKRLTWAKAIQNNCFEVNECPGNPGSEPCSFSHMPKGSKKISWDTYKD